MRSLRSICTSRSAFAPTRSMRCPRLGTASHFATSRCFPSSRASQSCPSAIARASCRWHACTRRTTCQFRARRGRLLRQGFPSRPRLKMPKLPRISAKKLLRVLLRTGFYVHHQRGSHVNLRHATKSHLHIVVPNHGGDLAPKTIKSILAQAELTVAELIALLGK